ncbi:Lsr2 family protein [Nocardia sp. NPDC058497]|uniref:histone-like nucleoid-structuring protein Lsr2 n=1 Tax=Nocardia sp. NPDC058497 TaxID=3346529 RepID=UPI00364A44B3
MARKVTVSVVDDLDGTTPADESISFGIDGARYQIDLSVSNAALLRKTLDEWIPHARKIRGTNATTSSARPTKVTNSTPASEQGAIRAWAATNGHPVSARGRIAADIIAAYHQATA